MEWGDGEMEEEARDQISEEEREEIPVKIEVKTEIEVQIKTQEMIDVGRLFILDNDGLDGALYGSGEKWILEV